MALVLLLVIMAIVLGIVGVAAKGLFYLLSSAWSFLQSPSSTRRCGSGEEAIDPAAESLAGGAYVYGRVGRLATG